MALLLVFPACDDATAPPLGEELDLSQPWFTATPEDVGADGTQISDAVDEARGNSRLLSLLAVKDGRLVVEESFRGNRADSLNDVRSVTKSVVSALTGIAVGMGFLSGVDDPIGHHLHPGIAVLDSAVQAITVRDLLTMTGGFEWDESGGTGSYLEWIVSDDHLDHLLSKPLVNTPGTTFVYNSAAVHLLGVVVEEAVGMPLPQFADEVLFGPIGIRERAWEALTRGYVNGGAGIDLRPRDLARFGQLFLQGGRSGGTQILPEGWSDDVTMPKFSWRADYGALQDYTYGYLWWVVTGDLETAYYAWGFGGQFIYVVPDLSLVIVATTEWRGITSDGGPSQFERATLDVIINGLVPAFRD